VWSYENAGVESIALAGECSDQVVVTGDEVDPVCLTNRIRRKFRYAKLISVENGEEGGDEGGQEEVEETKSQEIYPPSYPICSTSILPSFVCHQVVYDPYPNNCSIL